MTRLLNLCLLLTALLGLMGQATAVAMVPTRATSASMQASMAGMDCMDMANAPAPGKPPCKNMTLQCVAAMDCSPMAFTGSATLVTDPLFVTRDRTALLLAARLYGRSFGPELEPPTTLI